MRLQLAVEFSTGSYGKGVFDMSAKWGAEAADKLRKRVKDKEMRDHVLLENRKLLQEQGPNLWVYVCESVKQKCLELNENYRSVIVRVKDIALNQLDVRFELDGVATDLKVTFEPTSSQKALTWEYSGNAEKNTKNGSCPLFINQAGQVCFQQALLVRTPESLAEEMLNGLIAE
ncbi:hypothetical protein [Terracidiphilus gabretensis]|jgi:hypothetical protein|uniref:hypothetical protein n=1 Tax=Terracidiphilus gabretensis TaxID=1577687 RepID=UPI00071BA154|nr:hypothetical protein [Terracidiphilus gabretensis]